MFAMNIAATLDDVGKPAWVALLVLGFILWWPAGLAILAYLIWSKRMGRWKHYRHGYCGWWPEERARPNGAPRGFTETTGNRAFDEYRADTLRRLEEEHRDFLTFLERLRLAKDKAEFDQFMEERRQRPSAPDAAPPAA
jgi:hypothetical protein